MKDPASHLSDNASLKSKNPNNAEHKKLDAVLVTVASTDDVQNCKDLVNNVHITALHTNIIAKNSTLM